MYVPVMFNMIINLLVGMQICAVTLETSMVAFQKIEIQSTLGPSNTTLGHIHKGFLTCQQCPQQHHS